MRNRRAGFTLVEILVVLGIIAVLIGILLPVISRSREQARTLVCASNLRQLYQAEVLYCNMFNGYVIPAEAASGSSTQFWWWGINTLGVAYGFNNSYTTAAQKTQILQTIAKMLKCPSIEREPLTNIPYTGDYTYNDNLGDIRGQDPNNPSYQEYADWGAFKHLNRVPGNVLIAIDGAPVISAHDDRFVSLKDLTTINFSHPYPRASGPHSGKANMLFADGSVRRAVPSKDLKSWMIMAPGHLNNPDALFYTTNPDDVWQNGRPLPFQ